MMYSKKTQELVAAGFSLDEVRDYAASEWNRLRNAGFSKTEADQHLSETFGINYSLKPGDNENADDFKQLFFTDALKSQEAFIADEVDKIQPNPETSGRHPKSAKGFSEAALAGYEGSVAGLLLRRESPSLVLGPDATIGEKVVAGSAQMVGDLPTLIAGSAAAAPSANPAIMAAASMGLTEGTRQFLMDLYTQGAAKTSGEVLERTANTLISASRGAAVGAAGGTAGKFLGPSGKLASLGGEVAAMTTVGAAVHGHLPTADDFITAGVQVAGIKFANIYTRKFAQTFTEEGRTPNSVLSDVAFDPSIARDLSSSNMSVPRAYGGSIRRIFYVEPGSTNTGAKTPTNVVSTGGGKTAGWYYDSKNLANTIAGNLKNSGTVTEFALFRDLNFFKYSDTKAARVYKGFIDSTESEAVNMAKYSNLPIDQLAPIAKKAFEHPTPEFINYLSKTEGLEFDGIRMGPKTYIFDPEHVKSPVIKPSGNVPVDEAMAKINEHVSVGETPTTDLSQLVKRTYQAVIDKFSPLNEGVKVGKATLPYFEARRLMGSPGIAVHWLERGLTKFGTRETVGPSVKQILTGVDDLDAFRTYLVARRTVELNERGIQAGPDIDAAYTVAKDAGLNAKYGAAATQLYKFQDGLLRYLVDSGVMSEKNYKNIKAQNKDYVAFNRVIEAFEPTSEVGNKEIKGSSRDIIDPFETLVRQAFTTVRLAERNHVKGLIAKQFGVKVKDSKTAPIGSGEEAVASRTQVVFYSKGRRQVYAVPEAIAKTAELLDPETTEIFNGFMKAATSVASVTRAGAIFAPEFAVRNPIRDQFSAWFNSDSGYVIGLDAVRGLAALTSKATGGKLFPSLENVYWDWLKNGGANANMVAMDRRYSQETLAELTKTPVTNVIREPAKHLHEVAYLLNPINAPKHIFRALQKASEISEEATRLGEYMKSIKVGFSPAEAAFRSRESTIDFMRIGASTKAINAMSVFFNAKLQGADKVIRRVAADPNEALARVVSGVILPSALLALVQNDILYNDPDSEMAKMLREVPDWQRHIFWLIPTAYGVVRVPKPQEHGVLAAAPVEAFIHHMFESGDRSYLRKLADEGWFADAADQMVPNPLPTVFTPIIEATTNHSFFTNNPIVPPFMEKELPETQYGRQTSEIAKALSRQMSQIDPLLNMNVTRRLASPLIIDHLITGWTSSLGRYMLEGADWAAQQTILKGRDKPTKQLADIPIVRAFVVRYPSAGAKSLNDFDREATLMESRLASVKALAKEGNSASAARAEFLLNNPGGVASFNKIRSALGNMSSFVRLVDFSDEFTPDEKRELIDQTYLQMIEVAKGGLAVIDDIKRELKDAD